MRARTRFMAMAFALVCTTAALGAAQSGAKDDKKQEGTTVGSAAKATGTAVGGAAKATGRTARKGAAAVADSRVGEVSKTTGKKTAEGAKAVGSTTAKGAETTAGGAKKLGLGIKNAVTGDADKDKDSGRKK